LLFTESTLNQAIGKEILSIGPFLISIQTCQRQSNWRRTMQPEKKFFHLLVMLVTGMLILSACGP
jgi:hypothetical protein